MTATLPPQVSAARDLVDRVLRDAVGTLGPDVRTVVEYHLGWRDEVGRPRTSPAGKAVRPALVVLGAEAAGLTGDAAAPVPGLAAAVELVHDFSLLHDDVMDGDTSRRHRPTAWTVFGVPSAILAGDSLLALAVEVLRQSAPDPGAAGRATRCLTTAVQRLVDGQMSDVAFERRERVGLVECLAMQSGKTAALMRCAASIASVGADAPASVTADLAAFGEHVGMAFQSTDDLLGLWGSPDQTGKPALADLRVRKKSVPIVAALEGAGPAADRLRAAFADPEPFADEVLPVLAELVVAAGGRARAETEAGTQLAAARACLDALEDGGAPHGATAALWELACFVTGRDR